jgi:hypothetical protein
MLGGSVLSLAMLRHAFGIERLMSHPEKLVRCLPGSQREVAVRHARDCRPRCIRAGTGGRTRCYNCVPEAQCGAGVPVTLAAWAGATGTASCQPDETGTLPIGYFVLY